jgi:SAM-dependent methyltransferase
MTGPSPPLDNLRRAHPLAIALAERVPRGARVLELGTGSGRNADFLRQAAFHVYAMADGDLRRFAFPDERYDAALSTHGLLHATLGEAAAIVERCAAHLKPQAPFYCTLGSTRDERFGSGIRIAERVWAPESGDEAGVAHAYFDRRAARDLLDPSFIVEELLECEAAAVVGTWAHAPPRSRIHWFARTRRR